MPIFTANIAFLFNDRPFLDRIAAARAAGFDKVECHCPYDIPISALRGHLDAANVRMTGLNTRSDAVYRGCAGRPGEEDIFRRDFAQAADYARALGCRDIHVMAGLFDGKDRSASLRTYRKNLRWAAREVAGTDLMLVLEPLNTRSAPDYLVSRSDELAEIIADIGEPAIKLLFDIFHVQIMEGDLVTRIHRHRDVIGHVQVAGVPDRSEPDDDSEINCRAIFRALDDIGYRGLVGLEYMPRGKTEDGLGWLEPFRTAS